MATQQLVVFFGCRSLPMRQLSGNMGEVEIIGCNLTDENERFFIQRINENLCMK